MGCGMVRGDPQEDDLDFDTCLRIPTQSCMSTTFRVRRSFAARSGILEIVEREREQKRDRQARVAPWVSAALVVVASVSETDDLREVLKGFFLGTQLTDIADHASHLIELQDSAANIEIPYCDFESTSANTSTSEFSTMSVGKSMKNASWKRVGGGMQPATLKQHSKLCSFTKGSPPVSPR